MVSIAKISAGSWHALAVDIEGMVYSAGNNTHGELGRVGESKIFGLLEFEDDIRVNEIEAGFCVSFFIDTH